jgi:hypothetical protein
MPARVQHVATGVVQRQAEAESSPFADLGDTLQYLLAREQVQAAQFIVRPEITPG